MIPETTSRIRLLHSYVSGIQIISHMSSIDIAFDLEMLCNTLMQGIVWLSEIGLLIRGQSSFY